MAADFGSGGQHQDAIYDALLEIRVVLGTASLRVRELLKLGRGAVVELDRRIDAPADIYVANVLVARGEVTIVEDRIAITIRDFVQSNMR